jgi:conjugal transfer mating pair stabilization protein TraG
LFVLPLLGAATPLHAALGVAPRCLPSVAPPAIKTADAGPVLPEPGQVVPVLVPIPSFDAEERDYLIRTIVFEASGETEEGKVAVAHVILNRKRSGRWGDNIKDVVTRPWQFEPWMTKRGQIEKLSQEDPRYRDAALIADAVLAGEMPDPTAGATHFLNPVIVKQRRGGSLPAWARGKGQPIGRHTFYAPREAGALTERVALAFDDARDPLSC